MTVPKKLAAKFPEEGNRALKIIALCEGLHCSPKEAEDIPAWLEVAFFEKRHQEAKWQRKQSSGSGKGSIPIQTEEQ